MRILILIVALSGLAFSGASEDKKYCDAKSEPACTNVVASKNNVCCESSKIAGMEAHDAVLSKKLTDYAWNQIIASYDHLLLSVNFDTYTKDRPGFEKLYRGLSDNAWKKAIELLKYVTSRGGRMHDFWNVTSRHTTLEYLEPTSSDISNDIVPEKITIKASVSELLSIEEAIKIEKGMAKTAFALHNEVQSHHKNAKKDLDAGIAHFLEEEFIESQTETIRKLVGYHNNFKTMLGGEYECTKDKNLQLACFIFDEYLKKQ